MYFILRTLTAFCAVLLMPALAHSAGVTTPMLPQAPYNYDINAKPAQSATRRNHKATLGRVLFYDKHLSANNLVSCASCHRQENGFDDPSRFSIGFRGEITNRSSMGLTNVFFNGPRFFWDQRAASIRQQVLQPFVDPVEMGLKANELPARVKARAFYTGLFANAFGSTEITEGKIAAALALFVSSIVSTSSTYDKARLANIGPAVDFPEFSKRQNRGKMLFINPVENGGANCAKCHIPDFFFVTRQGSNNGLDANSDKDQGIGKITGLTSDMGKFRAPSLANIAERAPYMHDGRFASLEEVIEHYSTGIKNNSNLGAALKDKNGNPRRFNFSKDDKLALIEFLNTLSDPELLRDAKFSNPFR